MGRSLQPLNITSQESYKNTATEQQQNLTKIIASLWMIPICVMVSVPEGWDVIQRGTDGLKQWAQVNLMSQQNPI